nr:immunoglobulin heavy chain junction region [Mus musculus]MBK4197167.1 immunoglobulin heavy chain junction region [Mus musculus]MBK4197168.1 immunoglobulin heavy chain junction region [Mus musculus]MBK4197170.1 immunoglobulin heavy chain junction region [Mus musculus]MBK4197171.1 immunoglobulin heavy chain junction region [Mus musculus]
CARWGFPYWYFDVW